MFAVLRAPGPLHGPVRFRAALAESYRGLMESKMCRCRPPCRHHRHRRRCCVKTPRYPLNQRASFKPSYNSTGVGVTVCGEHWIELASPSLAASVDSDWWQVRLQHSSPVRNLRTRHWHGGGISLMGRCWQHNAKLAGLKFLKQWKWTEHFTPAHLHFSDKFLQRHVFRCVQLMTVFLKN